MSVYIEYGIWVMIVLLFDADDDISKDLFCICGQIG